MEYHNFRRFYDGHGTVLLGDGRYGIVEHRAYNFDSGERQAEVILYDSIDEAGVVIGRSRVADVTFERIGYGNEAMRSAINWSAWGAQNIKEASEFAEGIAIAVNLARGFADGFTYLRSNACDRCGEKMKHSDALAEVSRGKLIHAECMEEGEEVA